MKKAILLILYFLFSTGLMAQSDTYKIETLSKPEQLLPVVKPEELYGKMVDFRTETRDTGDNQYKNGEIQQKLLDGYGQISQGRDLWFLHRH